MKTAQKFKRGDVVHIAKDLGPMMSHFENDEDAIIMGSYRDQYGGDNVHDYTVMFLKDGGEVSWYEEHQLTFLRHGGEAEINAVKLKANRQHEIESDIHWIVANWLQIRERPSGTTMGALMRAIGITNPWPHGEGWELAENQYRTFHLLDQTLSIGTLEALNAKFKELGCEEIPPAQ